MSEIVFLYSDTGGGHRAAAQAVAQAIEMKYPGARKVTLLNAIHLLPAPFNQSQNTYSAALNQAMWLHRLNYAALNGARRMRLVGELFFALDGARVRGWAGACNADLVVSVQPHFNAFVPMALRRANSRAKYAHVITDLLHPHAFHVSRLADVTIAPNDEMREELRSAGIAAEKIAVCGQPIPPNFAQRAGNRQPTRAALGLTNSQPVVLMMGGGEGAGRTGEVARAIAASGLPIQLVVVCGRNENLRRQLEDTPPGVATVRALGFTEEIPELMGAADVLVTKAGPGTICEGFAAGLPMVLFEALPGQEEGNVDFVVGNGAGVWRSSTAQVVAQLRAWLADAPALRQIAQRSARLAKPDAAFRIAEALIGVRQG